MNDKPEYIHGRILGSKLCDLLGIDKKSVRLIRIECTLNDAAFVVVERLMRVEEATALGDEMKKYRAVPQAEWESLKLLDEGEES